MFSLSFSLLRLNTDPLLDTQTLQNGKDVSQDKQSHVNKGETMTIFILLVNKQFTIYLTSKDKNKITNVLKCLL